MCMRLLLPCSLSFVHVVVVVAVVAVVVVIVVVAVAVVVRQSRVEGVAATAIAVRGVEKTTSLHCGDCLHHCCMLYDRKISLCSQW